MQFCILRKRDLLSKNQPQEASTTTGAEAAATSDTKWPNSACLTETGLVGYW